VSCLTVHESIICMLSLPSNNEKNAKDKHSSLFWSTVIYKEKSFTTFTPGSNVIKYFRSIIYDVRNKQEFLTQADLSTLV
jgi:hypothetical protein